MRPISRHITPLGINSQGGGHTYKHTHKHTYRHPHRNNFKKPGVSGLKKLCKAHIITKLKHTRYFYYDNFTFE